MELRDLYQQVILDHNKSPRNWGTLEAPSHHAEGSNPLCGDQLRLYLAMEGDTLRDIRFEGSGCAISKSSASLMTESVKGKSRKEIDALFTNVHGVMTGEDVEADSALLGKLTVFQGVREFPSRVKCATLAWHTLNAALEGQEKVSTE